MTINSNFGIYTIYKATNLINGKCYIGYSGNWPLRKYGHEFSCIKKYDNTPFHNAIRKYGKENFLWETIYQSKDKNYTWKVMEPYFINEYNSHIKKNGYNVSFGGDGNKMIHLTKEHKKKISEALIGKIPKNLYQIQQNHSKLWKIITPKGDEYIKKNLAKFCKENNLITQNMWHVSKGHHKSHFGWKCVLIK